MPEQIVFNRTASSAPAADAALAVADGTRKKLMFMNVSYGKIHIYPRSGVPPLPNNIILMPWSDPLILDLREDGDLCLAEWWGGSDDGILAHNLIIAEVLEVP
ncbi:MAG TPA: hypothetical protein VFA60_14055 [Terriglobales bacterium]|jgi:hypothetical protein|nr:hypothetical protein [Terriglobales bacterium]